VVNFQDPLFDDIGANAAENVRRRRQQTGASQAEPEFEDDRPLTVLGAATDVTLGIARGLEGAVEDVYGLADAISGDRLRDYHRQLGQSRTIAGKLVEGLVNFGVGFVPFGAGLKAVSAAGKLGRVGKALANPIVRGAAAGALTDLTVFGAHEGRFVDMFQDTALDGAVVDFLATDEDDSEVVGRLKQAVEGAGIGFAFDAVFTVARTMRSAVKARRAATEAGATAEEAARAAREAAEKELPPEKARELVEEIKTAQEAAEENIEVTLGGRTTRLTADQAEAAARSADPEASILAREPLPSEVPGAAARAAAEVLPTAAAVPVKPRTLQESELLQGIGLSEEQTKSILDDVRLRQEQGLAAGVNPRDLSTAELIANRLKSSDINLSQWSGPDAALHLVRVGEELAERAAEGDIRKLKKLGFLSQGLDERAEASMRTLADITGSTPEELRVHLVRESKDIQEATIRANARAETFIGVVDAYSNANGRLADKIISGAASPEDMVRFQESMAVLGDLSGAVHGIKAERGRALRVLKEDPTAVFRNWREELAAGGGEASVLKMAKYVREAMDAGGAAGVTKLARNGAKAGFWDVTHELRYFAMLSSPKTFVTAGLSNIMTSMVLPLEHMVGGVLTGRSGAVLDYYNHMMGLFYATSDSLKAATTVAKTGQRQLDPSALAQTLAESGQRRAIFPGGGPEGLLNNAVTRFVGGIIESPGRAMTTIDEAVKQMNYRAIGRAELMRTALAKGMPPDQAARWVSDNMELLVDGGHALSTKNALDRGRMLAKQAGVEGDDAVESYAVRWVHGKVNGNELSYKELSALGGYALDRSREATHTGLLPEKTIGRTIQKAVLAHPSLRLIAPFVGTSVNIAKFAGGRLDVPSVVRVWASKAYPPYAQALQQSKMKFVQDALSGDPKLVADAYGRIASGVAVSATMYSLALSGKITGRGPADLDQRKLLEEAGWQPYSIKVGDKYVSYARLDPFATMIGLAADIVDGARWAEDVDQPEIEKLTYGFMGAIANNFANKTYLQGVAETMDVLTSTGGPQDEFKVNRYVQKFAASFVPNALRTGVDVGDPVMRDVRSMHDALFAKVPGYSTEVAPHRNILGEPVTRAQAIGSKQDRVSSILNAVLPITYRQVTSDDVRNELAALSYGFTPIRRNLNGLDLSQVRSRTGQTAFDRWGELQGQVKLGGKTLKTALRDLFRSEVYRSSSEVSTAEAQSPRISLVRGVLAKYREEAKSQMLSEFPDVERHQSEVYRQQRAGALSGERGNASILGRGLANPFSSLTNRS
jgi:DNA-directed RNA polymerase subunit F